MTKSSKILLKEIGLTSVAALIAIFSIYNLYSAVRYGVIYCGPRGNSSWQPFHGHSLDFIIAIVVYGFTSLILPTAIYSKIRENRRFDQNLSSHLNRPKLEGDKRNNAKMSDENQR